jgi:hypothetical protein
MSSKIIVVPPPRRRIVKTPEAEPGERLVADMPLEEEGGDARRKREPNSGSFQKGQSGNPKGRPKKAKGSKAIVRKILLEVVEVKVKGDRKKKATVFEALVMKERAAAFAGDWRARNTMFALGRWALIDRDDEQGDVATPAVTATGGLTETGKAILDWFAHEVRSNDPDAPADGGEA